MWTGNLQNSAEVGQSNDEIFEAGGERRSFVILAAVEETGELLPERSLVLVLSPAEARSISCAGNCCFKKSFDRGILPFGFMFHTVRREGSNKVKK